MRKERSPSICMIHLRSSIVQAKELSSGRHFPLCELHILGQDFYDLVAKRERGMLRSGRSVRTCMHGPKAEEKDCLTNSLRVMDPGEKERERKEGRKNSLVQDRERERENKNKNSFPL